MKMFSAIIVSGTLLMATAYTLRSHAAGAFEPQMASALASGDAWMAIGIDE